MDHPLGLAVVLADTHLEYGAVGVDQGSRHFETKDLTAQDALLDDGFGAGRPNDIGEGGDVRGERRLRAQRLGLGSHERRAVDAPDGRRTGECGRPAGEQAGSTIDDEVQFLEREPLGPEQSPAQGARRFLVSEHPTGAVLDERSSSREPLRPAVAIAPAPLDDGAQLGLAEGLLPLLVGYFFFPPRAP
jgi:hypothetical protein